MVEFDCYKSVFEKPFVREEVLDDDLIGRINARRAGLGLETCPRYRTFRRHSHLQWYWVVGMDGDGYQMPNVSTVVCFDGFVLMNGGFKRVMLQWNDFPKVSLDGGGTWMHPGKIRGELAIGGMNALCRQDGLSDELVEAINVADEICQIEMPDEEETEGYAMLWWKVLASAYGKDLTVPTN